MAKQTLTVQLMHANKRIAELETLFANAESARLALAIKLLPAGPTPARIAYLASRNVERAPSDFALRCAIAKAAAMAGGKAVRV
jgi:hypothetical protein